MQINVEAAFCYGPADKQQQPSLFGQLLLEHCIYTRGILGSLAPNKDTVVYMLITCENMQQTATTRASCHEADFSHQPNRQVARFRNGTWIVSSLLYVSADECPSKRTCPSQRPTVRRDSPLPFPFRRAWRVCGHTNYKGNVTHKKILHLIL